MPLKRCCQINFDSYLKIVKYFTLTALFIVCGRVRELAPASGQ